MDGLLPRHLCRVSSSDRHCICTSVCAVLQVVPTVFGPATPVTTRSDGTRVMKLPFGTAYLNDAAVIGSATYTREARKRDSASKSRATSSSFLVTAIAQQLQRTSSFADAAVRKVASMQQDAASASVRSRGVLSHTTTHTHARPPTRTHANNFSVCCLSPTSITHTLVCSWHCSG
jgi:hypothetical protein